MSYVIGDLNTIWSLLFVCDNKLHLSYNRLFS